MALSLAAFWTPFPKPQKTPVHCPALCAELSSMPFSSQPLVPADLASHLETRCSVLGSPFFGTEFGRYAFLCITDAWLYPRPSEVGIAKLRADPFWDWCCQACRFEEGRPMLPETESNSSASKYLGRWSLGYECRKYYWRRVCVRTRMLIEKVVFMLGFVSVVPPSWKTWMFRKWMVVFNAMGGCEPGTRIPRL